MKFQLAFATTVAGMILATAGLSALADTPADNTPPVAADSGTAPATDNTPNTATDSAAAPDSSTAPATDNTSKAAAESGTAPATESTEGSGALETVVVTAQRRTEDIQNVP